MNYLTESSRTASGQFHGDLVSLDELRLAFRSFITAANDLDRIKKLMFYGEDQAKGRVRTQYDGKSSHSAVGRLLGAMIEPSSSVDGTIEKAEFLLHAVLGIASEGGEFVENLDQVIFGGKADLDLINLTEEIGDAQWYEAMLCRVAGVTFEEVQERNIAKLRQRFPDAFTTDAANNRDLDSERAALEGAPLPVLYDGFYILSLKWSSGDNFTWWRSKNAGYTTHLNEAGLYSEEEVRANLSYYHNGEGSVAIPSAVVNQSIVTAVPISGALRQQLLKAGTEAFGEPRG